MISHLLRLAPFICVLFGFTSSAFTQQISGLSISPNPVAGGGKTTGTIYLSAAAPSGGLKISLKSSVTSVATVPTSVTIASGQKTGTFSIAAAPVTKKSISLITGEDPKSHIASGNVTVDEAPLRISEVSVAPSTIVAANAATGTITLTEKAPTGGLTIKLASNESYLTVPATVSVKAGSSTATFRIVTLPVSKAGPATVAGYDPNGYSAAGSVTVEVPAIRLTGLTVSPTAVAAGSTATGTVKLSEKAPSSGFKLTLSTMSTAIKLPMTVTVPSGAISATFTITSEAVSASTTASIDAVDSNGYVGSANLGVNFAVAVTMTDSYQFQPKTVTAPAGSMIVWSNPSFMSHTVNGDLSAENINSGSVVPNTTWSWTIPVGTKSGTKFYYHCNYHGIPGNGTALGTGMVGVIIVQ